MKAKLRFLVYHVTRFLVIEITSILMLFVGNSENITSIWFPEGVDAHMGTRYDTISDGLITIHGFSLWAKYGARTSNYDVVLVAPAWRIIMTPDSIVTSR